MPDYRRWYAPGATYFFTVVTWQRLPIFNNADARHCLGSVVRECRQRWPFENVALVLLPDHLHTIWSLPVGDCAYSRRWAWLKREFTNRWLQAEKSGTIWQRRRAVWQPRFWEHTIRNERDFGNHLDYIHYNPVKHGYVSRPQDWPYSSFQRFVKLGWYDADWGAVPTDRMLPNFAAMIRTVGE
jgi:putative transposase